MYIYEYAHTYTQHRSEQQKFMLQTIQYKDGNANKIAVKEIDRFQLDKSAAKSERRLERLEWWFKSMYA